MGRDWAWLRKRPASPTGSQELQETKNPSPELQETKNPAPLPQSPENPTSLQSSLRMDQHQLLQDREHVWLRTSERRGEYLHADDDGVGVSVQESRTSLNAAWAVHVHHSQRHGRCVLLHSAAYGRYLAATPTPAPLGHRGFRVVQSNYDQPEIEDIMWKVGRAGSGNAILLRSVTGLSLRANGKILRWNRGVTVDGTETTMMHWVVEPIPVSNVRPPLQDPVREGLPGDLSVVFRLREAALMHLIRFVLASNDGLYAQDEQGWESFLFTWRSVRRLRNELAGRLGLFDLIMCVRAGRYGRLTPLSHNLPRYGSGSIQIVVIRPGTPAANALRHPNVDVAE